jgi:peptidylprolyl isomerase
MKPGRVLFTATLLITISLPLYAAGQTKQQSSDGSAVKETKHQRHKARHRRKHRKQVANVHFGDGHSVHAVTLYTPLSVAAVITRSGLVYMITQHGSGRQPLAGETVIVNYTGLLGSGVKFDSSLDRGKPFEFPLGAGRVIKGWDEGIAKLHVGDQATLIIPPELGYGARGAGGVIPPNATLIFLVELVGIKEAAGPN